MSKTSITIREIIKETLIYSKSTDMCVQKIKQKLAHLRRVMYQELEHKKLMQPHEQIPGTETISFQMPLSTDEILDIVYDELDHSIEGLEQEKKNLTEMSKNEN